MTQRNLYQTSSEVLAGRQSAGSQRCWRWQKCWQWHRLPVGCQLMLIFMGQTWALDLYGIFGCHFTPIISINSKPRAETNQQVMDARLSSQHKVLGIGALIALHTCNAELPIISKYWPLLFAVSFGEGRDVKIELHHSL